MKNLLYIISCFVGFISFAQDTLSTNSQTNKTELSVHSLSEAINTKKYSEVNPILSPDGKTIYFSRLNHPDNNYGVAGSQDIWYSEKDSAGNWTIAKRMPDHINNHRYNSVFAVLNNGYTLVIDGIFNSRGNWKGRGLSETHLVSDQWSIPKTIKVKGLEKKNKGQSFTAFMSFEHGVLIMGLAKGYKSKKTNLYVSKKKLGRDYWTKPKKMKPMKHANSIEQAPFLSNDGDTLYFSSNYSFDNHKNAGKKDFNIYYCVKIDDDYRTWTEPKILDKISQTDKYESDFIIDPTGEVAYFTSVKNGSADIYEVRIFEKEPYVELRGQVIDMFKNAPIEEGTEYEIKIRRKVIASEDEYAKGVDKLPLEDIVVDSLSLSDTASSAAFAYRLPFGHVYEIEVETMVFNTEPIIIDTYKDKEHRLVNQDLFVKPLNLNQDSLLNIPTVSCLNDTSIYVVGANWVIQDLWIDKLRADSNVSNVKRIDSYLNQNELEAGTYTFKYQITDKKRVKSICTLNIIIKKEVIEIKKKYEFKKEEIIMVIYDNKTQDGDRISVYFNGEKIADNYVVQNKDVGVLKKNLKLVPGKENIIVVQALNTGDVGNNTVKVDFYDKEKKKLLESEPKYSKVYDSTPGFSSGISLKYKK